MPDTTRPRHCERRRKRSGCSNAPIPTSRHCEERSDEAISLTLSPKAAAKRDPERFHELYQEITRAHDTGESDD